MGVAGVSSGVWVPLPLATGLSVVGCGDGVSAASLPIATPK